MTHTTTVVDKNSGGDFETVVADLDITSLDNAASEDFAPKTEFNLRGVLNVDVGLLENPGSYTVQATDDFDLSVVNHDGTNPTSGTDVGTVRVSVHGNRGP